MADNVENVALKARKTKLNNKSKDDLIAIILRKDDVERKLNSKVDAAKDQVSKITDSLAESNKKYDKLLADNKELTATNNTLKAKNQSLSESLAGSQSEVITLKERNQLLADTISKKNVIMVIIAGIAVLAVVFAII